MQFTVLATRRTPHGPSRLVQANLPGPQTSDVLRPGIVGMRGSPVIAGPERRRPASGTREFPSWDTKSNVYSSNPPPSPDITRDTMESICRPKAPIIAVIHRTRAAPSTTALAATAWPAGSDFGASTLDATRLLPIQHQRQGICCGPRI